MKPLHIHWTVPGGSLLYTLFRKIFAVTWSMSLPGEWHSQKTIVSHRFAGRNTRVMPLSDAHSLPRFGTPHRSQQLCLPDWGGTGSRPAARTALVRSICPPWSHNRSTVAKFCPNIVNSDEAETSVRIASVQNRRAGSVAKQPDFTVQLHALRV